MHSSERIQRLTKHVRGVVAKFCVYVLLMCAYTSWAGDLPIVRRVHGEHIIELPEKMQSALMNFSATFVPWKQSQYWPSGIADYPFSERQAPFAVVGDFNGDGILDVVLVGHDAGNDVAVALLSKGDSFEPLEIWRAPLSYPEKEVIEGPASGQPLGTGLYEWLLLEPKESKKASGDPKLIEKPDGSREPLTLKGDAFHYIIYEKGDNLFVLQGHKFVEYWWSSFDRVYKLRKG